MGRFFVGMAVIVLIAGCSGIDLGPFPSDTGDHPPSATPGMDIPPAESGARPCPEGPLFSRAPVDLEDISSVGPLGSLIPPGHTFPTPHLYLFVFGSQDVEGAPATLYAPGDMILSNVIFKYQEHRESISDYTDYDMHFSVCDDVELYFIHVQSITHPEVVAAMQAGDCPATGSDREYRECHLHMGIPIQAGTVLGATGDFEARIFGLDVGVRDHRLPEGRSAFINPDRWCDVENPFIAEHCYAACFFDYLAADLAAPYLDLIRRGSGDTAIQRTEAPVCGTIYHDVPASAQGYWFPSLEVPTSESNSLFLGPNDFLPSYHSFSVSNAIPGLRSFVYSYAPQSSGLVNRGFDEIMDNEIYCFDRLYDSLESLVQQASHSMDFVIVLQPSGDGKILTIEKQEAAACGSGPWSFSDQAVVFYR